MPEKARMTRKNTTRSRASTGSAKRVARRRDPAARGGARPRRARLSGNSAMTPRNAANDSPAAIRPGVCEIGGRQIVAGEDAAQHRPDDEAEAERRADHAHSPGALFGRRHVGDIGLRRGDVAGAGAGKGARGKQHPQPGGEGEPEIGQRRRRHARHQYRAPADTVAEPSPERRRHHRHQRIDGEQQRHLQRRGGEPLRVKRQQRDDQPEPDQVDENDEEEDWHERAVDIAPALCAEQEPIDAAAPCGRALRSPRSAVRSTVAAPRRQQFVCPAPGRQPMSGAGSRFRRDPAAVPTGGRWSAQHSRRQRLPEIPDRTVNKPTL